MAFKVEFEIKITDKLKKALEEATKPIDEITAKKVAIDVIKKMKSLIRRGESPIDGNGKFPKYKNPKRYPGKLKPKTPVNLKLTGKFLDSLRSRHKPNRYGIGTELYFPAKQELKEQGHREGANGQPERPILPSVKGEKFTKDIRDLYTELYRERILEVLKSKG